MSDTSTQIEHILLWADENPKFDTSFVLSVEEWIETDKPLTTAQANAIDKIYRKFHIAKWIANH